MDKEKVVGLTKKSETKKIKELETENTKEVGLNIAKR